MSSSEVTNDFVTDWQNNVKDRFARNIVAETVTIFLIVLFGFASSILIVRGLPQTPVYEFYIYILVFTWVNLLIPVGIMGVDVALMKHLPEVVSRQSFSLYRLIAWSIFTSIMVSLGAVLGMNLLLVWLPPSFLVPALVVPFLQLALLTLPLTVVSMVLQGVFRGMQEMRYCAQAMGLYHGLYFVGLAFLFFSGAMTLVGVIFLNIAISMVTILFELGILWILFRRYKPDRAKISTATKPIMGTAVQALMLALFGAAFLNIPLLIANIFRTSDVILAGLGLALSIAMYLHRGQAAPFRVLMPRTSGDVVQKAWTSIKEYMSRAWKLGLLFNAFIAVVIVFYATPFLVVFFAEEGLVAVPFLALMTGSFLIYPLASMMKDTLIGIGSMRGVLLTYSTWTGFVFVVLWFLCPIGREIVAALIWLPGIPFLLILLLLYQRRTSIQITTSFIPRVIGVLAGIALLSFTLLFAGWYIIIIWNLTGVFSWIFQILILLSLVPLSVLYLWSLIKTNVLDAADVMALIRMSEVLHPLTKPVTWLISRLRQGV